MTVLVLDPAVLDRMAAPSPEQQASEEDELRARRRRRYWLRKSRVLLGYLPRVEREMLELYWLRGCPQRQIGQLYGVSTQAVGKALAQALERLRWLASWPGVGLQREDFEGQLADVFPQRVVVLLWVLVQTSSQSDAARAAGYRQQTANRRVHAALRRLRGRPELRRCYLAVRGVVDRPGVLSRVRGGVEPMVCRTVEAAQ